MFCLSVFLTTRRIAPLPLWQADRAAQSAFGLTVCNSDEAPHPTQAGAAPVGAGSPSFILAGTATSINFGFGKFKPAMMAPNSSRDCGVAGIEVMGNRHA